MKDQAESMSNLIQQKQPKPKPPASSTLPPGSTTSSSSSFSSSHATPQNTPPPKRPTNQPFAAKLPHQVSPVPSKQSTPVHSARPVPLPVRPVAKPQPPVQPKIPSRPADQPKVPSRIADSPRVPTRPTDSPRVPLRPADKPRVPSRPLDTPRIPLRPADSPRIPLRPADSPRVPTRAVNHPSTVPTDLLIDYQGDGSPQPSDSPPARSDLRPIAANPASADRYVEGRRVPFEGRLPVDGSSSPVIVRKRPSLPPVSATTHSNHAPQRTRADGIVTVATNTAATTAATTTNRIALPKRPPTIGKEIDRPSDSMISTTTTTATTSSPAVVKSTTDLGGSTSNSTSTSNSISTSDSTSVKHLCPPDGRGIRHITCPYRSTTQCIYMSYCTLTLFRTSCYSVSSVGNTHSNHAS